MQEPFPPCFSKRILTWVREGVCRDHMATPGLFVAPFDNTRIKQSVTCGGQVVRVNLWASPSKRRSASFASMPGCVAAPSLASSAWIASAAQTRHCSAVATTGTNKETAIYPRPLHVKCPPLVSSLMAGISRSPQPSPTRAAGRRGLRALGTHAGPGMARRGEPLHRPSGHPIERTPRLCRSSPWPGRCSVTRRGCGHFTSRLRHARPVEHRAGLAHSGDTASPSRCRRPISTRHARYISGTAAPQTPPR